MSEAVVSLKKVLLAEDDGALRNMFRVMIGDEYEVMTVREGAEAWSTIREHKPDLVILDMQMPKMSGLQVLAKMKEAGFLPQIPTVVVSNIGNEKLIEKAIEMGAREYVKKDEIELAGLQALCRKYLKGRVEQEK